MKQITKEGIISLGDFPQWLTSAFGSGPDGNQILDGTNTFSWANKSGSGSGATYTLLRSVYLTSLTIGTASNTITLKTNGFKIYAGTLTITKGSISCDGNGNYSGCLAKEKWSLVSSAQIRVRKKNLILCWTPENSRHNLGAWAKRSSFKDVGSAMMT